MEVLLGLPQKKSIFLSQNDNFGCILMQLLTGRSLGKRILRFNREKTLERTVQNYPKIHGQTKRGGGGRTIAPRP